MIFLAQIIRMGNLLMEDSPLLPLLLIDNS
jgi:hypothetical protein